MDLANRFKEIFQTEHESVYQAPARINLIGEHIDYNGGKVLPAAISCYITAFVSKRNDPFVFVYSNNFSNLFASSLDDIKYSEKNAWANYIFGMFEILKEEGYKIPTGLNILLDSKIPLGSGLSSSAALLVLVCYIIDDIFKLGIDAKLAAKLAQMTENRFLGLKSGIMDEAAISLGKKNKALLLDCAKFEYEYEDIKLGDYAFVVLKTNKPRKLTESKYNERVDECQKALSILKTKFNVNNLSELKVSELPEIEKLLNDDVLFRRVKHVVTENDRVHHFIKAMKDGDIKVMSELLNASHESLKVDYEVTGQHLDTIVTAALNAGAPGARMTGAGFGGCAIALIKKGTFEEFKEKVDKEYFSILQIHPDAFEVDIVDGPKKIN